MARGTTESSVDTFAESASSQSSESRTQKSGKMVKLVNLTNRNIELDLGRDKEIRIPSRGETVVHSDVLNTQQFKLEASSLTVYPV